MKTTTKTTTTTTKAPATKSTKSAPKASKLPKGTLPDGSIDANTPPTGRKVKEPKGSKKSHPRSWLNGSGEKAAPTGLVAGIAPPKARKVPRLVKDAKVSMCWCHGDRQTMSRFCMGGDARVHGQCLRVMRGQLKPSEVPALKNPAAVAWIREKAWASPEMLKALGL